jgi:hypothetical protein
MKNIKKIIKTSKLYENIAYRKKNVFNTNFNKKVLLSYIVSPFKQKQVSHSHSNKLEAKSLAKILSDFNFDVDVYDFRYDSKIDYSEYSLIIGFGQPIENSFYTRFDGKRIFYGTGAHVCHQNNAELKRIKDLYYRKDKMLTPKRLVSQTWSSSTMLSDALFIIGNDWTSSTYRKFYDGPIYNIPVSAYEFFPFKKINRDWSKTKKNFLWIGSGGLVHKGLDLCIDTFKEMIDYNLHICGPKEEGFFDLYEDELENKNIIYHGFVDISSLKFKRLVEKCGFVIFPSCSEGTSGSVLTAMFTGLIPLVTKETGVNIKDFGFLIDDINIKSLKEKTKKISSIEENDLKTKSHKSFDYCKKNHTIKNYKKTIKKYLKELINEWKI